MSIHAVGSIVLVVIFVVGTLRLINLGALALIATYLVGTFLAREGLPEMYRGFPVDLLILLAGVTYLFGVAVNNGTVDRIVGGATRLFRGRRALIPWIVFVVASLPAMAGALGSAGVAMLAPLSLQLAKRYDIDRRMIGLMVVHGAAAGNFSPLNVLGALVRQAVVRSGLEFDASTLFFGNLGYNLVLAAIIYFAFGGHRLAGRAPVAVEIEPLAAVGGRLRADQLCTLAALLGVAIAALGFDLSIGFVALGAAALLQLLFPASSGAADRKIAWGVILLVCGIVTYVSALQRYGTVQAIGDAIATLNRPLLTALLICAVGAVTSAFASSAGILGALIPLAVPFMAAGDVATTAMVVALALSATVVDATPFSTVGALVVASADEGERPFVYRGLLAWGAIMVLTAPLVSWLVFIVGGCCFTPG